MMALQLSAAARILSASQRGADVAFRGVSTDSRKPMPGALFFALHGPNFDGHAFVEAARQQGAAAAAVSRPLDTSLPLLQVDDTRLALGALCAAWRRRFRLPVVAITGSNGKTTVRAMLASILSRCGRTLSTQGNLNNDIGLPLTLARLDAADRFAVIEMGANHPGEIDYLAGIAAPTIGVITNAAPAHLEGFGDLDGVARAKGELFARLAPDGVAILNADDPRAPLWRSLAAHCRRLEFGLAPGCDVTAHWEGDVSGSTLQLVTPQDGIALRLPLPGRHNVMNALAASAAALAAGAGLAEIRAGLEALTPVAGRFDVHALPGAITVIDDTYNANPGSLQVALDVLARAPGAHWLVLGDMGELGATGVQLHREAGVQARQAGVARLFTLGALAAEAAAGFGAGATVCTSLEELLAALHAELHGPLQILVKGSRRMRMERVVQGLVPSSAAEGH
jgi:UDP-N-acetylmuramoyl-tripeptide--D-alanyl-D-alanine ligase